MIPLIEQLQGLQSSISQTSQELAEVTNKFAQGNGYSVESLKEQLEQLTQHQLHLIDAFSSALKQLEALGCFMKDLQLGLIDFYCLHQDKLIFLCWKMGEEAITFWHDVEEGYAGRKPIDKIS